MTIQHDLEVIARQETRLQFERFDASIAWELGCRLKAMAEARNLIVAIEIWLAGSPVFLYAMSGTNPDNLEWLQRKRRVVERFHRCSYAVGLGLLQRNTTLQERYGLDIADYAAHGGSFPVRIKDIGVIGSITVSGLAQREDHELVIEALSDHLDQAFEELQLSRE